MMNELKRVALIVSIAVSLAAPAASQPQQTPQGAQTFIRLTAVNGSTKLGIPLEGGSYNMVAYNEDRKAQRCHTDFWGGTRCPTVVVGQRTVRKYREIYVSKAESIDTCTTRLTYYIMPKYTNDTTYVPGTFTINWKAVTQAVQSGNGSGTEVTLNGERISFYLSSPELATRFAYAAKFLRDACDPTAATGF